MPYQAPGVRVKKRSTARRARPPWRCSSTATWSTSTDDQGRGGQVRPDHRWILPVDAAKIAGGEEFIIAVGGVVEVVLAAPNPVSLIPGDYVEVSAAGVVTKGTAGTVTGNTLGVVQQVDTTRTPNVARVNTNLP